MEADIASGAALQEFVVLAKSAKGKAAKGVVEQAIGHPNVFVFGELLDQPSVQEVSIAFRQSINCSSFKNWNRLLSNCWKYLHMAPTRTTFEVSRFYLFVFSWHNSGTEQQKLPALTPTQATKLRKLTIVSLSCNQKV